MVLRDMLLDSARMRVCLADRNRPAAGHGARAGIDEVHWMQRLGNGRFSMPPATHPCLGTVDRSRHDASPRAEAAFRQLTRDRPGDLLAPSNRRFVNATHGPTPGDRLQAFLHLEADRAHCRSRVP
jgi:hypothetical protein